MSPIASSVVAGVALGLQFNPLASGVGSAVAAGLAGRPGARRWYAPTALAVLVAAWVVGDFLVAAPARAGVGADARAVLLSARSLSGFTVGYLLPAATGVFVGRRVVKGRGWPSAIAVALMVSVALSVLAPPIADALWGMVPAAVRG